MSNTDLTKSKAWQDRISLQRTKLMLNHPFFAVIAIKLGCEAVDGTVTKTLCTDGKALYVNPDYIDKLSNDELLFGLAHEAMHVALDHIPRLRGKDAKVWNKATDYVINNELKSYGLTLPKTALLNPDYNNLSSEQIYDILSKQPDKNNPPNNDGDGIGDIQLPKGSTSEQDESFAENRVTTQTAAAIAKGKNAGKLPASIERALKDKASIVNWREILRHFMDDKCLQDYTWSRPSRNSLANDIYLPGLIDIGMSHLVVAIDTSGSVNEELLNEFAGEIRGCADENHVEKITVIYADTQVKHTQTFHLGEPINLNPKGGGGTDFRDTFEYIRKHANDAKLIVYLTDMEVYNWGTPPDNAPVLWGAYGPGAVKNTKPPFGDVMIVR